MGTESVEVCYHSIEGTAGTDGFLLGHFFIGNTVFAVQFAPCTFYHDIVEGGFNPSLVVFSKIIGCLHAKSFEFCSIASPNAPNFIDWIELQSFNTLFISVNHAAMVVALVFLGKVAGHLCKGFIGSKPNADRHTYTTLDFLVKFLAPGFQVQVLHTVKIDKAFVYAITEVSRCLLADDRDYTTCQFAIQFVVR